MADTVNPTSYPPDRAFISREGNLHLPSGVQVRDSAGTDKAPAIAALTAAGAARANDLTDAGAAAANALPGALPGGATFVVGTQAEDDIVVTVQLKDAAEENMARASVVHAYLSDSDAGVGVAATAPDGGMVAGVAGALTDLVAGKVIMLESNASGVANIVITESGADTFYLVVILPNGAKAVSGAIEFTTG